MISLRRRLVAGLNFFRPLRDVKRGDQVQLVTGHGAWNYEVTEISVVEPDQVEVLKARREDWLFKRVGCPSMNTGIDVTVHETLKPRANSAVQ